jgi:hypothetical protein
MRIRQVIDISGTIDGKEWPGRGEELDLPDHVAEDLIANKYAERVDKPSKVSQPIETASADPVQETASVAKTRQKRSPVDKG